MSDGDEEYAAYAYGAGAAADIPASDRVARVSFDGPALNASPPLVLNFGTPLFNFQTVNSSGIAAEPAQFIDGFAQGRNRPGGAIAHAATDVFCAVGTPVFSMWDSAVTYVGWDHYGGWGIEGVAKGRKGLGICWFFCHLYQKPAIAAGDTLAAGAPIGFAANSGGGPIGTFKANQPHLHVRLRAWANGVIGEVMNPYELLTQLFVPSGASGTYTSSRLKGGQTVRANTLYYDSPLGEALWRRQREAVTKLAKETKG